MPKKIKPLQWAEDEVDIHSLKPHPRNPRTIDKLAFERLKISLANDGYHGRLLVDTHSHIIGGHQRWLALKQLGWKKIKMLRPNRELTPKEFNRILIRDNLNEGRFDFDILSNDFEADELQQWGFPTEMLTGAPPLGEEEKASEEKQAKCISCPECGFEFEP